VVIVRTAKRAPGRPSRERRRPAGEGRRSCLRASASPRWATAPSARPFRRACWSAGGQIEATPACGQRLSGVLQPARAATSRRSSRASDLVVEVKGGMDPARGYVLRAMAAEAHVVTAKAAARPARRGAVGGGARERRASCARAAVAGCASSGFCRSRGRAHVERLARDLNGRRTSSSPGWPRPAPHTTTALGPPGGAQRLGTPRADPSKTSRQGRRGQQVAILARRGIQPQTVHLEQRPLRGPRADHRRRNGSTRATSGGVKLMGQRSAF